MVAIAVLAICINLPRPSVILVAQLLLSAVCTLSHVIIDPSLVRFLGLILVILVILVHQWPQSLPSSQVACTKIQRNSAAFLLRIFVALPYGREVHGRCPAEPGAQAHS